jgi:hypothetical protein
VAGNFRENSRRFSLVLAGVQTRRDVSAASWKPAKGTEIVAQSNIGSTIGLSLSGVA